MFGMLVLFLKKTWLFHFKAMKSISKMMSLYLVILRVGSAFWGVLVLENWLVPDSNIGSFFLPMLDPIWVQVSRAKPDFSCTLFFGVLFFQGWDKKGPMLGPCFIWWAGSEILARAHPCMRFLSQRGHIMARFPLPPRTEISLSDLLFFLQRTRWMQLNYFCKNKPDYSDSNSGAVPHKISVGLEAHRLTKCC